MSTAGCWRPLDLSGGLAFGAQYYRAPTPPPEDWERDLDSMRAHGMNTVKLWAQWRWNNPAPGECWWDDLDRLMDLAADRDLRVVINVVFDVMPAWLLREHPDCLMVRMDGRVLHPTALPHRQIGGAPGPCLNHVGARVRRLEFLEATVTRYRDHHGLWLWDLWNEPELTCGIVRGGPPADQVCWCPSCISAFSAWVVAAYHSLGALNTAWARNYREWTEVEPPRELGVSPAWVDWRLFTRDYVVHEMSARAEATRSIDPVHPVMCHTVPPPIFNIACCGSDDFELAHVCDVFGNTSSASMPVMTDYAVSGGAGRPMIASEIHALPGCTLSRPAPLSRKDLWRQILVPLFQGVKGFLFWQYRAELLGQEAPAWGMTKPDGTPEPWLEDCPELARFLADNAEFLTRAKPDQPQVHIAVVPENEVFFYSHDGSFDRYWAGVMGAYRLLCDVGLRVGFVHPRTVEDRLTIGRVVAPVPYAYPRHIAAWLAEVPKWGGTLLSEGFVCAHDPATAMAATTNPGFGLDEVFGCREARVVPSARVDVRASYGAGGVSAASQPQFTTIGRIGGLPAGTKIPGRFAEQHLVPTTGRALATFADGSAAIVENTVGDGRAVLIGCWLFQAYSENPSREIRALVAGLLNLPPRAAHSPDVRVDRLSDGATSWLLLRNETGSDVVARVTLDYPFATAKLLPARTGLERDGAGFATAVPGDGLAVVEVT